MKTPLHNPTIREADEATRAEQEARRSQFMSTDHVDPDLAGYDARRPTAVPNIENHWAIGRRRTADESGPEAPWIAGEYWDAATIAAPLTLTHDDLVAARDCLVKAGISLGRLLDAVLPLMESVAEPPRHGYRELRSGGRGQWWDRRSIDNQPLYRLGNP